MNESYWQKTSQHPCFKQLNKDIKTDILIIGGGLSGISCAYQLKETGKQITIVEKNLLGSHTSGHTTAKITLLQGLIYQKLVKHYNIETAYLYYQSQKEAMKGIKDLIEKANNLNKDNYKDFTEVEKAINAVVTGKNITQQDEVDAMAKAINDAIGALVFQLKIKYKSNGGTGTMANPAIELDKEFTFPECEYVAPNGKHFKGWQVDNTVYKVGDKRVFTKDDQNKEIKAVWEEHTFDQKLKEVNEVSTLKDKATCTTNAIYYKSCTCGQVSTIETFEDKDTKL